MTSNQIKNQVLAYYRFLRGVPYVATECWECDVVVYDPKVDTFTEIEVKTSWDDYRNDFLKKKYQAVCGDHERYMIFSGYYAQPHMKYFAAPTDLAERIAEDLAEKKSPFGCIRVPENCDPMVIRRGKRLKNGNITERGVLGIVMRMGSELITVRQKVRT